MPKKSQINEYSDPYVFQYKLGVSKLEWCQSLAPVIFLDSSNDSSNDQFKLKFLALRPPI